MSSTCKNWWLIYDLIEFSKDWKEFRIKIYYSYIFNLKYLK